MKVADPTIQKVEDFLKSLVKTAKILHFYPENNPMGQIALKECLQHLSELETKQGITFAVTSENLFFEEASLSGDHPGLHHLTRQLYVFGIDKLTIERNISEKEMRNFCWILGMNPRELARKGGISNVLSEEGIKHIRVVESGPPRIIETEEAFTKFLADIISRRKQEIQESLSQKQTARRYVTRQPRIAVKIDADLDLTSLPVDEINRLIDDHQRLSHLLSDLSRHEEDPKKWGKLVGQKFIEIQQILEIFDSRQKSEVFQRIARSIVKMSPEIKEQLICNSLLPALLENQEEGEILRFLSDFDLVRALTSLSKVGISLPRAFAQALDNLHLPERRKSSILPLLENELKKRGHQIDDIPPFQAKKRDIEIMDLENQSQNFTKGRISFGVSSDWLQNLDITLNSRDRELLKSLQLQLNKIDPVKTELQCLFNLIQLERDLETCRGFADRISNLLTQLINRECWQDLAIWLSHLRAMAGDGSGKRSVTETLVREILSSLASGSLVQRLVKKYHLDKDEERKKQYLDLLGDLGEFAIPVFIQILDSEEHLSVRRTVINIMLKLAPSYDANNLSSYISHPHWYVVRNIVWLLGRLGPGSENIIAQTFNYQHPKVVREAIRSLALIASPVAVEKIIFLLESENRLFRRMAAEHLAGLPGDILQPYAIRLLSRPDFLQKDIFVTLKLLEALEAMSGGDIVKLLRRLGRLRFLFWNWKFLLIGLRARKILKIVEKSFLPGKSR